MAVARNEECKSVIAHRSYSIEPWCLRETSLDLGVLAQSESLFALANGHVGWRGNLDEGEPHELSGSYLNGVFENQPLPYAEIAYGYPDHDEVVVDVTNGKVLRLFVDDEPFDVRYGTLLHHERLIDFREGVLQRAVEWTSPSGAGVAVKSSRLVSLSQRALGAIDYTVTALDRTIRIVVQSELIANEPPPPRTKDPRTAFTVDHPWLSVEHSHESTRVELVHRTEGSGLMIAAAMDHEVNCDAEMQVETECFPDLGRVSISTTLTPGQSLHLTKYVAYGWSSQRSQDALRDQVDAALTTATHDHFSGLVQQQHDYLAEFWRHADVEIEGNDEIQQAVRFSLFHLLQSSARAERRGLPAKGLTGSGYNGHTFWDTEMFVLPVLTYLMPRTVADALTWRHDILPIARQRALDLGLRGAALPWRTISGVECSGYWPAGTAAFHINADVADAVLRYLHATRDEAFEKHIGGEILIETARLWSSLGHFDTHGDFRIDGVTGPDEYSAIADNNVYTNLLAQRNFRGAAEVVERYPELAEDHHVRTDEVDEWRRAADNMTIARDEQLGVHSQSEGFTSHDRWNFESTRADQYPLLLNFPYFDLYRKQVVKQADLVLAMYVCPEAFTDAEKLKNFDYYETITVQTCSSRTGRCG